MSKNVGQQSNSKFPQGFHAATQTGDTDYSSGSPPDVSSGPTEIRGRGV